MLRQRPAFWLVLMSSGLGAAAHADVHGRVVDAVTAAPIAGATVYGDAPEASVTTGDGFALPGEPPAVTVLAAGYAARIVDVAELGAEAAAPLVIDLAPEGPAGEVIEVAGGRVATTPGTTTLERAEITRVPGARGDVLSAVKNLPGIANNGALTPFSAGLIIRGASPEDSRILVDGFEIPVLYHFLGVQSVLPSEMIDDIEYLPGTFGVAHGRASGGIVSVTSRSGATEHRGFAELSFINAGGLIEGPIGKRGSYAVAGRRSVIDAILPFAIPDDAGLSFTAYPAYYDYQGAISYAPRDRWTLRGFVFGSNDHVELLDENDNAADPLMAGGVTNTTSFTRAIASATYRRPGLAATAAVSAYTDTNHVTIGPARYLRLDRDGIAGRAEATWDPTARLRLTAGAEADLTRTRFDMVFVRPPAEGEAADPNFTADAPLVARGEETAPDLGAWTAATVFPTPRVELSAGVRVDAFLRNDREVVQPRGHAIWRIADGSAVRAAAGLYTRPPEYLDEGLQDDLAPERAWQTSAGAEQRLAPGLTIKATAFYNRLSDLLVPSAARRDPSSASAGYANTGAGTSYGAELMLELRRADVFGWIAYTASRAERRDEPMAAARRFDYDQTHNLIVLGSWKLGERWQLGGRFQLTTGKPYTPVTGATYLAELDLYEPAFGAINSRRVEVQHQLDVRVDRIWTFSGWKLAAYLDVSNVYINAPAIDYQYNFDYSARTAVRTLPILPSFGVRGEF
jgi:outer membrane receptor protein involved in Fe transport